MSQFDVHARRSRGSYLLDIQTDFLSYLESRLVVPLIPTGIGLLAATRLNPIVLIDSTPYLMLTQSAAAVSARDLGKTIVSVRDDRDKIIAAIDFLVTGV